MQAMHPARSPSTSAIQARSRSGSWPAAYRPMISATISSKATLQPNSRLYISPCASTIQPRSPGCVGRTNHHARHCSPTDTTVSVMSRLGRCRPPRQPPPARETELLELAYAYVLEHGISDLSLRPLATAIGSSPRVLLFLFESKDGLVRRLLARARQDELDGPVDVHRVWAWLSDPTHAGLLRLWTEAYARSLTDPDGPVGRLRAGDRRGLAGAAGRRPAGSAPTYRPRPRPAHRQPSHSSAARCSTCSPRATGTGSTARSRHALSALGV